MSCQGASRVPVEVLNQIFELVKQPLEDHTFLPQFPLTPLILVCKSWHPVAERLLYESIAIGSHFFKFTDFYYADVAQSLDNSGHKLGFKALLKGLAAVNASHEQIAKPKGRPASVFVQQLLETLENNGRLAGIVKELRILSQVEKDNKSLNHAMVLAACPNISHVEIRYESFSLLARDILVDSLKTKSLISFKLCCLLNNKSLLEVPTFLRIMANWRDIKHVQISPYGLLHSAPEDNDDDVEPGCCSQVQVFDIERSTAMLRSRDLRNLLRMCPAGIKVFKASLTMDNGMHAVLQPCLRAWAPTLEIVDLRGSWRYDSPSPAPISDDVAKLSKLTVLALSTFIMDPHALSILPNLTEFTVEQTSLSECKIMLLALKDFKKFPALQSVYLMRGQYTDDPEEVELLKMSDEVSCIRGFPIYI